MLNSNDWNWIKIDEENEEAYVGGVRYVRPLGVEAISLDCPVCKKLIATVEDVEAMKKEGCCEECYLIYYYPNKEKWEKGWRPSNT